MFTFVSSFWFALWVFKTKSKIKPDSIVICPAPTLSLCGLGLSLISIWDLNIQIFRENGSTKRIQRRPSMTSNQWAPLTNVKYAPLAKNRRTHWGENQLNPRFSLESFPVKRKKRSINRKLVILADLCTTESVAQSASLLIYFRCSLIDWTKLSEPILVHGVPSDSIR